MTMKSIQLGDKVRDSISGLEGIVTGRSIYLFGCAHVLVNPQQTKDNVPVEGTWMDEARCVLLVASEVGVPVNASEREGGPLNLPPTH